MRTSSIIIASVFFTAISILLALIYQQPSSPSTAPMARVIVVGSGLAGLSAAYEASKAGAKVIMLERASRPGGNSIKASSGINGANTRFQRSAGVPEDASFYGDSVRSAGKRFPTRRDVVDREALVSMLVDRSAEAVNWLADEIGVDLSVVAPLGGHSVARTHRGAAAPPGMAIVNGLTKKLEGMNFTLELSSRVSSLKTSADGAVTGVEYYQGDADVPSTAEGSVVFTTGGFAGDANGELARYRPDLEGIPSTCQPVSGCHDMLAAVGAELVDMDSVQIHPTGFVDPADPTASVKFLAAEMLRGEGGILVGPDGSRFVNEMETRERVSAAVMSLPGADDDGDDGAVRQWDVRIVLDPGAAAAAATNVKFYTFKKFLEKRKISDLEPALVSAIDRYSRTVAGGEEDEFGRRSFGHWTLRPGQHDQEVHVGRVTPITHFTMGGAAIDSRARVLGRGGKPIAGLFAAGEITGGIHGDNRLGGSSLLECVVFGRTAGREASRGEV